MTFFSGLASAVVHMVVLITLGLLFANLHQEGKLELQLAISAMSAPDVLETIDLALDDRAAAEPTQASSLDFRNTMTIREPTLALELDSTRLESQAMDVAANLAEAIDVPVPAEGEGNAGDSGRFFGASAYGDEFLYVVDMSTSMGYASHYGQTRFRIACRELMRSIHALKDNQKFCVIMFSYRTRFMFDRPPKLLSATVRNKQRLAQWIAMLRLHSGTDPRFGVMTAMRMKPDAIFLLSDGEFNGRGVNMHGLPGDPRIENLIVKQRRHNIPIHTIAFEDLHNRRRLRKIAGMTNGSHRFVGHVSDQDLLLTDLRSRNLDDVSYAMECIIAGTHKMRDDVHLRRAVGLIGRKLTAPRAALRKKAYQAMVALADGEDLGPHEQPATIADYKAAQQRWKDYWQDTLKRPSVAKPVDSSVRVSAL